MSRTTPCNIITPLTSCFCKRCFLCSVPCFTALTKYPCLCTSCGTHAHSFTTKLPGPVPPQSFPSDAYTNCLAGGSLRNWYLASHGHNGQGCVIVSSTPCTVQIFLGCITLFDIRCDLHAGSATYESPHAVHCTFPFLRFFYDSFISSL